MIIILSFCFVATFFSESDYNKISSSMADAGASQGYFKEGSSGGGSYMKDKLSGKL